MITYEKVTDQHLRVFKHGLLISEIGVNKNSYTVYNRHSSIVIPKTAKKSIKDVLNMLYNEDLKTLKLFEYVKTENEGMLSIKKMMKILKDG